MVNTNRRYTPLPNTLFRFRVPAIATYTPEEISMYGMNVNMINGRADMSSLYHLVPISVTLDRIIDIYLNGYRPILLMDKDDIDKIYTILDEYVRGINFNSNYMINMPGVIEERLYDIERFAAEIFDHNKLGILKKALKFEHGYDAKVDTVNMNTVTNNYHPEYNSRAYSSHMDGYRTYSSNTDNLNRPIMNNQYSYQAQEDYNNTKGSTLDAFRVNPNKEVLSNTTYVNSNLPQVDYDAIYRKKTIIKLNKEQ